VGSRIAVLPPSAAGRPVAVNWPGRLSFSTPRSAAGPQVSREFEMEAIIQRPEKQSPEEKQRLASQRDVGAVVNALRILQYLAATTAPVGVAAVARGTRISTSTCFNILRTLARARFVSFHPTEKTYTLGLAMAELAAGLIGISHAELIRPELERLALNYDTLILLWRVTEDNHLILIDRAHSQTAVRVEIRVGYRLPLFAGSIGRCVAAALHLPPSELRRRFAALRWQSPPSFATYQAEVAQTRENGWSRDDGNLYRGLISVAALVKDHEGRPRFGFSGVSIAGQQPQERLEQLGRDLRDLASLVSRSLFPRGAANGE
jgi:DNA-binding IclR family transcriptional regulator